MTVHHGNWVLTTDEINSRFNKRGECRSFTPGELKKEFDYRKRREKEKNKFKFRDDKKKEAYKYYHSQPLRDSSKFQ